MSMNAFQEKEWVSDHFHRMMAKGTPAARMVYLLEHPVLLSSVALQFIQEARPEDPVANSALVYLDDRRLYLWEHYTDYPLGHGPLEKVIAGLRTGEIGYEEALQQARELECSGQLSNTYLHAVMLSWVEELDNDVAFTLQAAEIALEAAWAMPLPHLARDIRHAAVGGFINLVHGGLMRRPDGRLYARAIEIGEWAWQDAEKQAKLPLKGEYLHELGTLVLDAYAANFGPSPDYAARIEAWLTKAVDPMPKPSTGLAQARKYLSASVELRKPGSERGNTLKALLEAVIYEAYSCKREPHPDRVRLLADRALADLVPRTDENAIERVLALKSLCG